MAVKDIFRRMRPVQLYVVLGLTTLFFLTELVVSHVTHALTLLVDSYHMLCNLIALLGCIATVKESLPWSQRRERRLRNTFGWARIDVLVLLIGTVFLASLCFSLVVEALQTLFHIGHSDEMHHPIPVLCVGALGVLLNGLCYLLIGGYTFHQGSFLHVTATGEVEVVEEEEGVVEEGGVVVEEEEAPRQGPKQVLRDVIGCILVIICSITVYFTDASVAKYADPIISIISAVLLLVLSYPYMKESGLILLQTIPDHINIDSLRSRLCDAFAGAVVGVHDLHIWQLTPQRTYATAHVVFINSKEISSVMRQVSEFFHEQGISHVTIQPEFLRGSSAPAHAEADVICFLQCAGRTGSCSNLHCCDEAKGDPLALPHHHHLRAPPMEHPPDASQNKREAAPDGCEDALLPSRPESISAAIQ